MDGKKIVLITLIIILGIVFIYLIWPKETTTTSSTARTVSGLVDLPEPVISSGGMSVEQAIQNRRSIRQYTAQALTLQDVSQLLWAAQGITDHSTNFRAAPSAGHVYPLEVYLVVGKGGVTGLGEGVYHYDPSKNRLEKIKEGDTRPELAQAATGQSWVEQAPVNIVITGVYQRMIDKYKDVALSQRFVHLEAGHVGENIYLEAVSRNLGTVSLGSFYDDQMRSILLLPADESPLYIFPVGHPG